MSGEGLPQLTRRQVPDFDSAVQTATDEGAAVGTNADGFDRTVLSGEGLPQFSRRQVPNFEGVIVTATDEGVAVGADADGLDDIVVSGESLGGLEHWVAR